MKLNPTDYISLSPWLYHDEYFHKEMRGKYGVHDCGCGCCSDEIVLSKEELIQLIDKMIGYLQTMKEKYQNE